MSRSLRLSHTLLPIISGPLGICKSITNGFQLRPPAYLSRPYFGEKVSRRAFCITSPRTYKTVEEAKSRYRSGPFSATAGVLFVLSGVGLIIYFRHEKTRMERKRVAEATKGIGKPKVGGSFELVNQDGEAWSSENMKGRYSLVYFGFSHCPDICPDELDKMARMVDLVNASPLLAGTSDDSENARLKKLPPLIPLFITCDPARDTPAVLKTYLAEFHPGIIGLTGTWEQVKDTCKKYRVYFSTPEGVQKGQDYLVDHSIYFYLMDPDGDFVEAIGREFSPQRAADVILAHVGDWVSGKR
ncbi:BgTH12-04594 [Blumeria graminis f. sp. triticale]|uniref:Bgt-2069 n=3 Tax=Blumeria graminis TaxID=34373 RepID=A0A381L4Y6_BLUGR|nr:Copper-binding protein of the mitochondrial inner membrane [Blumeria graminis f. sp. tritici 96224]CAD6498938.1 BgTH12-04594 [Blumeria graminis f. sp. triticale]VCU39058.1 Bgt-2069 [Blumeria graminis f. sp. tritici]